MDSQERGKKMKLRIYRTFTWEYDQTNREIRIDETYSQHIVSHDELQFSTIDNCKEIWQSVPIVEGPIP